MARADDAHHGDSWGTWEELLLACAVNRHGTRNWDSVAMELQGRTASPLILTPHNCKQKYRDLRRRFAPDDGRIDDGGDDNDDHRSVPWLDELRKLRVAELRRDVQRYDVSIVSLQLKVKKLTEERERSLQRNDNNGEKLDLVKDDADDDTSAEKEKGDEDDKSSPGNVADKRLADEDSDPENRSFSESNSTDPKDETRETGPEQPDRRPEERFAKPEAGGKADLPSADSAEAKPTGEGSYNGSSDTVAKVPTSPPSKTPGTVPVTETGESTEFRESVAESNGAKESSDVQSSASLSKKTRRKRKQSGDSSGDEPEADDVSPENKRICAKSQPLLGCLEIIRSHKHGSLFERRLESQESEAYQRAIRQHVDLETVRSRLEEGLYGDNHLDFFRDLLLLCNNAIVFFRKSSTEHTAATQLREIVTKELRDTTKRTNSASKDAAAAAALLSVKPALHAVSPSVGEKPNSSGPLSFCRKRSLIAAKAAVDSKSAEKVKPEVEEKPDLGTKEADDSSANLNADPRVTKKRTRDRPGTGPRGSRTGKGRNNGSSNSIKTPNTSTNLNTTPTLTAAATKVTPPAENAEKRNPNSLAVAKKRSAANFLSRMKGSSSSNGPLLETLKNTQSSSNNVKATEGKKGGKVEGKREQVPRPGATGKQAAAAAPEQSSPVVKRSVGRPPKKATGQQSAPSPAGGSKGKKETADVETRTPARKRARR